MRPSLALALSSSLSLFACGGEEPTSIPAPSPSPSPSAEPTCARGTIEPDFAPIGPLAGPGVDPATGTLRPPPSGTSYVVSSTYLALRPEGPAQQTFGALMGPIGDALRTQEGLVAFELGSSASCGTARTLTVWVSEEAMYGFVASPAHTAAVAQVGQVSRGGSVVTHWDADTVDAAGWAEAQRRLAAFMGRQY
jgi:heme-degrading monooxygenase HmoA